jgi:carboxyl-terminal processing protease
MNFGSPRSWMLAGTLLLPFAPAAFAQDTAEDNGRLPLDDLQLFVQIFDQIRNAYVEEVDDSELFEHAIEGMLAGLDPHSVYLTEDSFEDLQESTTGEFGGLGIEVGMEDGFIKVVAPIDSSPAAKAGLRTGDLIIKLDDQPVQGMGMNDAIDHMRGEKGTTITLTILRPGIDAPFEVKIIRDIIKVQSVRSKVLNDKFGYIRIAQFQTETGSQFRKEAKKLLASDPKIEGIVLDLRNNPGGLLPSCVEIADAVLDSGLIVYTEGRIASASGEFRASPGDILQNLPLVVIINGGSASASEILAGAIQDNQRGIVIGTKSFGKGSVQTVLPLRDDKAIKLTTARYFTPSGNSIQARGITPDIVVEPAQVKVLEEGNVITEASLSGHLENGGSNKREREDKNAEQNSFSIEDDNQLYEALNILRGIAIFNKPK